MIITNKIRDSNNLNLSCNSQKINNKLLWYKFYEILTYKSLVFKSFLLY
jgi:hypothetical protein